LTGELLFTNIKFLLFNFIFDMQYDLEERTTRFSEKIIDFARSIPLDDITKPLIVQLIKSGTSIGANYREANEGSSKRDFKNKIFIISSIFC